MDILIRLRFVLWGLVMGLWGLMVWQFLGDDEKPEQQQMRWVNKQVVSVHRRDVSVDDDLPDIEQDQTIAPERLFATKPPDDLTPQPEAVVRNQETGAKLARIPAAVSSMPRTIAPTPGFRGIAPENMRRAEPEPAERRPEPQPEARPAPPQDEDAPAPKGFTKTQTRHFNIYAEGKPPSLEFQETVENIQANLMLDLAAFSPWARDERRPDGLPPALVQGRDDGRHRQEEPDGR
ncbi:hypothetical protein EPO15_05210, partial [bacterium]